MEEIGSVIVHNSRMNQYGFNADTQKVPGGENDADFSALLIRTDAIRFYIGPSKQDCRESCVLTQNSLQCLSDAYGLYPYSMSILNNGELWMDYYKPDDTSMM